MELRTNPRYPIQCPIVFSGDDNTIGQGTVVNLSTGGWRVRSDTQPRPGTYLALHVLLPDEAPPMEVDLAAVRWAWGSEFGGWACAHCHFSAAQPTPVMDRLILVDPFDTNGLPVYEEVQDMADLDLPF